MSISMVDMVRLRKPYLLFLGNAPDAMHAKTSSGIAHWRRDDCLAQFGLIDDGVDLGLPNMTIAQAAEAGAKTFILGLAPVGGGLPDEWVSLCVEALEAGMDIAAGLHTRIAAIPEVTAASQKTGRQIFDVREPPADLPCGSGVKRSGRRLLTVGSDCCVGKMYSSLALHREMVKRGHKASFRATGQTGILIDGSGIAVDAVVSDFLSGAVEVLSPDNDPDHWDIIEGQGSLYHPAYAGVSLGLLHGAQADLLVLCHELGRTNIDGGYPGYPIPGLREVADLNLVHARRTNPGAELLGVSVNSSNLPEATAKDEMARLEEELQVPVVDPVLTGSGRLADRLEHFS